MDAAGDDFTASVVPRGCPTPAATQQTSPPDLDPVAGVLPGSVQKAGGSNTPEHSGPLVEARDALDTGKTSLFEAQVERRDGQIYREPGSQETSSSSQSQDSTEQKSSQDESERPNAQEDPAISAGHEEFNGEGLGSEAATEFAGVAVLGPCGEWRRWPRSRRISIEKRPEGFGFTLRNVVAYPAHIHKIATSLGKRPIDVEPWWVEGKPLDAVVVREVRESGAAQTAGLRTNDRIVAYRGGIIESYAKFVAHVHQCSSVLELVVVAGADDPLLSSGLLATGIAAPNSGSISRSILNCPAAVPSPSDSGHGGNSTSCGISPVAVPLQRTHWLSSSLAPRPYLSSSSRETTSPTLAGHLRGKQPHPPKSLHTLRNSPINQSTVSLTESVTTGGSVSGAESEMSLSLPSIPLTTSTPCAAANGSMTVISSGPLPPSVSVPSSLAGQQAEAGWRQSLIEGSQLERREQKKKKSKTKKNKRSSEGLAKLGGDGGSRSSSVGSALDAPLTSPVPASVAAKLQLFEGGGQGFLARSMEKLKLYRSELTRIASPPPNTVQVRTAQFEKGASVSVGAGKPDRLQASAGNCAPIPERSLGAAENRTFWHSSGTNRDKAVAATDKKSGTTSPPPGVSLKKLRTLFTDKSSQNSGNGGCALKILRCPDHGKRLDHNWRPAGVHLKKSATGDPVLNIVTDKESINVVVNKLLSDPASSNVHVSLASSELAKRRKNVLRVSAGGTLDGSVRQCSYCPQENELSSSSPPEDAEYEFLVQCDTPVTVHNICSAMRTTENDALQLGPSVIERAAAFDRRFVRNHQPPSGVPAPKQTSVSSGRSGQRKSAEVSVQRSKSRRASVGDEPCVAVSRRRVAGPNQAGCMGSIGVPLELCPPSSENPLVPWLVAHCCSIIEARGLDVLGIYRVPGNSAAVQQLTANVNNVAAAKNANAGGPMAHAKLDDPRWLDVNVVSSLLKSFFRLLPEPLLTGVLYEHFIAVDKIPDCRHRLAALHVLVDKLPPLHFATLQYFCAHLQRVAARADVNKMDSRNLSIVLGPTLVRAGSASGPAQNSMLSMISDMRHQCHLTETFVNYADFLFNEDSLSSSALTTFVDLDALPSSSSSTDSLGLVGASTSLSSAFPLSSKLCLLPGVTAPALSVKEKIQSFESGKPSVLEESTFGRKLPPPPLTSSVSLETPSSIRGLSGEQSSIPTLRKIASEEAGQVQQRKQSQKSILRLRATVSQGEGPSEPCQDASSRMSDRSHGDPMSLSYNERRVLVAEKAKVFEEETRALLEKKKFRGQASAGGGGSGANEQRMNREQTERRWQEVKRQATLLTRDTSDENIDKENQSSQNMADSGPALCLGPATSPRSSAVEAVCASAEAAPGSVIAEAARYRPPGESFKGDKEKAREDCAPAADKGGAGLASARCDSEEVVILRTKSGRSPKQQAHGNRSNRNGVVYSTHSSNVLKSIVQLDDRSRASGEGATQRKKSRLQRRHTIAGHSHHRLLDPGPASGNGSRTEKSHLVRAPSERKPRLSLHRATT